MEYFIDIFGVILTDVTDGALQYTNINFDIVTLLWSNILPLISVKIILIISVKAFNTSYQLLSITS